MTDRLHVGTRKGLFEIRRRANEWEVTQSWFLGDPVSAIATNWRSELFVALDLGHFGAKLWRLSREGDWRELSAPVYPPKPEDGKDDPHPWSLTKIWSMERGGVDGRLWAGTIPGGLFRSDDDGETWSMNDSLWLMPERRQWLGIAGDLPGINTILVHPRNPADVRIGVSCAGVWATTDDGKKWSNINHGMYNEYMPPERRGEPMVQDVHLLARCAAQPEIMWCQHHNGVFRSTDSGANWTEITAIRPSKFGFSVAAHPTDPNTAWFAPAVKDERRIPVDGQIVVARTRDAGQSFEVLRNGLPQRHAYDLVWRHGLAVDPTGEALAMGSTSGGLWISQNGGESWTMPDARLPPISVVRWANN
jgi:hypothetical protein